MRIWLIRHGEDQPGLRGGWGGQGLTELGWAQARAVAVCLASQPNPPQVVLSSDLRRSAETTAAIAEALSLPAILVPEWREINNGTLAGMPNVEAERQYPGLYFATLRMDEAYPEGESPRQFLKRIQDAFQILCHHIEVGELPSNVAVVTHGGVINIISHLIDGLPWTNKNTAMPIGTASIHELHCNDGTWTISQRNQVDHLHNPEDQ